MGTIIAVDVGGTHLRAAAFTSDQIEPSAHQRVQTLANQPGVFDRMVRAIEQVWPGDHTVSGMGVASPGPLDPHTGYLLSTPNIRQLDNFPLAPSLAERFGVPVFLDNDAKLACLGEWKYGAGKGHEDVLYLTISTGIGGGVITKNKLLRGFHGLATELGHTVVDPDGPVCSCGFKGHLESFSSGPAIVKYVRAELERGVSSTLPVDPNLTASQVADAAIRGDSLAARAYQRAGEYLGIGVASFLHAFDPSVVIFGGGVSQVGSLLFDPFRSSLQKRVFHPRYLENLKIEMAALGDDAGLLGARTLAEFSLLGKG